MRTRAFWLLSSGSSNGERSQGALQGLSYKGTNPFGEGVASWANHLSKLPLPNNYHIPDQVSTYEFWEDICSPLQLYKRKRNCHFGQAAEWLFVLLVTAAQAYPGSPRQTQSGSSRKGIAEGGESLCWGCTGDSGTFCVVALSRLVAAMLLADMKRRAWQQATWTMTPDGKGHVRNWKSEC